MSRVAILFGVLAAVSWGLSPVFVKRGFTTGGNPLSAALVFVIIGTVGLWGLTFATVSIDMITAGLDPHTAAPFFLGGVIGTGIGRLLNYSGVRSLGASINSSGIATEPVFAAILGVVILGESVSLIQSLGVCLVVSGLVAAVLSGGGNNQGWSIYLILLPLGAACMYGTGAVLRRFGLVSTATSPIHAAALNETAALITLGGYAFFRMEDQLLPDDMLQSYLYFALAGTVNTVGLLSFFVSIDNGPVVIGSTLAGTSTLVTVSASAIVLNDVERVTITTVVGALTIVTGVLLTV